MKILKIIFFILLVYFHVFIILMGSGELRIFDVFWIGTLLILISGAVIYFKRKYKGKKDEND